MSVGVVSGGAGGIGRGVVDALLDTGARVAVLDLHASERATISIVCDVTDAGSVDAAIDRVVSELGAPQYLVCAAGIVVPGSVVETPSPEWQRVVDVSLTSTFLLAQAVVPHMVGNGGGSIVALSSGFARKGYANGASYAAAKSGVEALTKSIALEHARHSVRCNAVAPGPIRTAMIEANANFDEQHAVDQIPMGRIGEVADVVDPIMFLLGDGARYVTGQILQVNGGMLMP